VSWGIIANVKSSLIDSLSSNYIVKEEVIIDSVFVSTPVWHGLLGIDILGIGIFISGYL
jgi:hypothetical protein